MVQGVGIYKIEFLIILSVHRRKTVDLDVLINRGLNFKDRCSSIGRSIALGVVCFFGASCPSCKELLILLLQQLLLLGLGDLTNIVLPFVKLTLSFVRLTRHYLRSHCKLLLFFLVEVNLLRIV